MMSSCTHTLARSLIAITFLCVVAATVVAEPLSPAFVYQGQLKQNGAPVDATCDMQFVLWSAENGGIPIAGPLTETGVSVQNGLFSVSLDFGVSGFDGDARWLAVDVRCPSGSGGYTSLSPRQPLTATPYALETRGVFVDSAKQVGIGTVTPGARLEVADNQAVVRVNSAGLNGSVLDLHNTNKDPSSLGWIDFSHTSGTFGRISYSWSGMDFGSPGSISLRITPTGNVGIGTLTPGAKLDVSAFGLTAVNGTSNGIGVYGSHRGSGTYPGVWGETDSASAGASAIRGYATATTGSAFGIDGRSNSAGGVGVNAQNDANGTALRAVGNGSYREQATVRIENTQPNAGMAAYIKSQGSWAAMHLENSGTGEVLWLENTGQGPFIVANDRAAGVWKFWVDKDGVTNVRVLQIHGGADFSESFDVGASPTNEADDDVTPEPGMIVSIDPNHPGKLVVSSRPYDPTVAGIISGAGGVKPGMTMSQEGTAAAGDLPVALSGRVYCRCDASHGEIKPGDLLTTSSRPGYAMKVTDRARAAGAVIGKAMTPLHDGTGLVLVLVSLQ